MRESKVKTEEIEEENVKKVPSQHLKRTLCHKPYIILKVNADECTMLAALVSQEFDLPGAGSFAQQLLEQMIEKLAESLTARGDDD